MDRGREREGERKREGEREKKVCAQRCQSSSEHHLQWCWSIIVAICGVYTNKFKHSSSLPLGLSAVTPVTTVLWYFSTDAHCDHECTCTGQINMALSGVSSTRANSSKN